jgi:hypothetical protein
MFISGSAYILAYIVHLHQARGSVFDEFKRAENRAADQSITARRSEAER